jgi:membrane protease YdiL (CAAX protease family)
MSDFSSGLGSLVSALFLLVSVLVYVALIRQIATRRSTENAESIRTFSLPEAILAAALVSFLLLNVSAGASQNPMRLTSRDLAANFLFTVVVVFFVATFLRLRRIDLNSLGGFSAMSFRRALSTGTVLLFAAYPLIALGDLIAQRVYGAGSSKQGIVDLFNESDTIEQRVLIIILAVAVAPIAEEFLFRFFLYGVLKRYFGRALGVVSNALLFAAVHAHLPSFAPLLVLGTCFTLAYEWSGSILVSMTMHSLFNSFTLVVLAFPEVFKQ